MVAILSCGLRDDSRIKKKLSANKVDIDTLLIAHAVDRLGILIWQKTKDGQRGKNRPVSFVENIIGSTKDKRIKASGFDSIEEYEEAKIMILRSCGHG